MHEHLLIVMVGLPYSGKSTWVRAYMELASEQRVAIVSPDSIRLALHGQRYVRETEIVVWMIAEIMVRALFMAGHDTVILDATNTTRKSRDQWAKQAWSTRFHVVDTSREHCIERAELEGDDNILPVIERMADQYEALGEDEEILR